ncbi:MAG TPA: lamin tail domain-containing protein [Candidatus Paceibacterota bacterium]
MVTAKIELMLALATFVIFPTIASAQASTVASGQVVITEVMYDVSGADTGREWVEFFNTGEGAVKLTTWKLYENGTKHKIVAASGVNTLAPHTYAIVADNPAKFRTDWPQFSGVLFDSAFSLSNDGETIALLDASSTEIASVSYQGSSGAAGDGNSLNRSPENTSAFTPHTPSPGAVMSTAVIPPPPPKPTAVKTPAPRTSVKTGTTVKKTTVSDGSASPTGVIIGDAPVQEDPVQSNDFSPESQTAAPTPIAPRSWWWGGAAALALLGGGAMVAARSKAKSEWKIEESSG